ncbi:methyltransferase [Thalassotalea maritima]|uniref:methyltransferase n=1 Tax=Thalassotalea maritima TaxID=3242416 RepID=UPI003528B5C0
MSLTNPSQLLVRNMHLLEGNNILVIGCPDPLFFQELSEHSPHAQVTSYNINYADHQAIKQQNPDVDCVFSEQYHTINKHDLVIYYFPKSKPEFVMHMAMLSNYLTEQAIVMFVGENKGGVKSVTKLAKPYAARCDKVDSARHCILFEMIFNNQSCDFDLEQWFKSYPLTLNDTTLIVKALPGVFSHSELDIGTKLLLDNLPALSGQVLDFGCGAGVIGCFVKKANPHVRIDMLDVNALAIASAKRTLQENQLEGHVFASNGLQQVTDNYHVVLSNPPFHQGLKTHYFVTEQFLENIKHHMQPKATLTIVANNFLKYAPIIKNALNNYQLIANERGFAIHQAQR